MPITRIPTKDELQKIAAAGGNPAQYAGKPLQFYTDQEMAAMQPKSNATSAGLRSAAASVAPTIAGGIGAGVGMGALEGSGLGPLGTIGGGLIGAITGGYAASKAQQALMPEQWQAQLAQDEKEHPVASEVGSIATLPLGGFSPGGVGNAVRGAGDLLASSGANPLYRQALINAGAGAGIGAVQEAAQEKIQGQDLSAGRILGQAAIGSVFNKKNSFGDKYNSINQAIGLPGGFHANTENPLIGDWKDTVRANQERSIGQGDAVAPTSDQSANAAGKTISAYDKPIDQLAMDFAGAPGNYVSDGKGGIKYVPMKDAAQSGLHMMQLIGQGIEPEVNPSVRSEQLRIAQNERQQQQNEEQYKVQQELVRQKVAQQQTDLAANALDLQQALKGNQLGGKESRPNPLATTESGRDIMPDYTGNQEFDAEHSASNSDLAERRAAGFNDKYSKANEGLQQEDTRPQVEAVAGAKQTLKDAGINHGIDSETAKQTLDMLSQVHGVAGKVNPDLESKGTYNPQDGVNLGPIATQDTPYHEYLHGIWQSLPKNVQDLYTANTLGKVQKYNEDVNKYNAANPSAPMRPVDAQEHFAMQTGLKTIARLAVNDKTWGGWWNDLKARLKTNSGKASDTDIERSAIQQVLYGGVKLPSGLGSIQESKEGLTPEQKREQRLVQMRANAANQRSRNSTLHENATGASVRSAGVAPITYPHDPEYSAPVSGREERVPYTISDDQYGTAKLAELDSLIRKSIGANVQDIKGRVNQSKDTESKFKYIDQGKGKDADDITNRVKNEILTTGIDKDGLEKSVMRRVNDAIAEHFKEKKETLPTVSLDRNLDTEGVESAHEHTAAATTGGVDTVRELLNSKVAEHLPEEVIQHLESLDPDSEAPDAATLRRLIDESQHSKPNEGLKTEVRKKSDEELKKGYEDYQIKGKKEMESGELQRAVESITHAQFHREEIERRNGTYHESKSGEGLKTQPNFLFVKPELDVARDKSGPEGKKVAAHIQDFFAEKPQLRAKFSERTLAQASKMRPGDISRVHNWMQRESQDNKFYRNQLNNDAQRKLYDAARADLKTKAVWAKNNGMLIKDKGVLREHAQNPFYYPGVIKSHVIQQIAEKGPEYNAIKKRFQEYWKSKNYTPEEVQERWSNMLKMSSPQTSNHTKFAGARIAEGMGIPLEFAEPSLPKTFAKYANRVATDYAWRKSVENLPDVQKHLSEDSEERLPQFDKIVEKIQGEPFDKDEGLVKALNRVFTSSMLGPLTNVHIGLSSMFNPMQYMKASELASVYSKGLANFSEANQHALENGYAQRDLSTFKDVLDKSNGVTSQLNAMASAIGRVNGRQFTDRFSKVFAQSVSEQIMPLRIRDANAGDERSVKLMEQLDGQWKKDKTYTPEEQTKLASTLAGFIHGNHDPRTLPAILTGEGWIKPFLSLMSWSTAQTNQWIKHVWIPATNGNIEPLLMSALGAVAGGYAIQQIRQMVTDKKSSIPSLHEIALSDKGLLGNIPLLAYNFMQMASFTGFAGIGAMLGKDVFDMAYKNIPQSSGFPLDEVTSEGAGTIANAVSAWLQTPNSEAFFNIFPRMAVDLTKDISQSGRIATNWLADAGQSSPNENYKYKLNTAESQLRRYKMVEGQPYDQQTEPNNNPYLNIPQKSFKQTTDLGQAASEVPALVQQASVRAQGNPEIFKQQLQSLKQNSYQSMPSIETAPLQFSRYYHYLIATQGKAKADAMVKDYMQHTMADRAKASLIP